MNLKSRCLVCGIADNLNTEMKVKVDDNEYEVVFCDAHSEDTTPKHAKELVRIKLKVFDEFKKQAAEFGLSFQETTTPVPAQTKIVELPVAVGVVQSKPIQKSNNTQLPRLRPINAEGASNPSFDVAHVVRQVAEAAKAKGKIQGDVSVPEIQDVEVQTVNGPQGVPMALPKKVRDSSGVTDINIVETSDAELQRRAKALEREKDTTNAHLFIKGYNLRECPLCRGKGKAGVGTCPKCKGTGYGG